MKKALSALFNWMPIIYGIGFLAPLFAASMGMQYHIVHHLHPAIPLFDAGRAYWNMRDILKARSCRIGGLSLTPGNALIPIARPHPEGGLS